MENVKDIERIVKDGIVVDVAGQKYSAVDLKQVMDNRRIAHVNLNTLTGFVDFIMSKSEDTSNCLIFIEDYNQVCLITPIDDATKRRDYYIVAKLRKENEFNFGNYMDHEEFIIKVKSLIKDSYQRDQLMAFVSSLTINNSIDTKDDGVTQQVAIKRGMSGALKDKGEAPSIISLAPFRTFREIDQPESDFLFRMKAFDQKIPVCALFEADGGEWKNKAIAEIKKFLEDQKLGLTIIA